MDSVRGDKKYRLQILQPAQDELEQIARIHMELVGPHSAQKITDAIYTAMERLTIFPLLGRSCRDKPLRLEHFRMLICGKYLCFYRLQNDTIFVYHIVDGRSDYPNHLRDFGTSEDAQ